MQALLYEVEGGQLCAVFKTKKEHQSYPGRLHGGISAAILDEIVGRAAMIKDPGCWSVTTNFHTRYLKPVPIGVELKALARVTKESRLLYEASGEIYLPDGSIAVKAAGSYMKMPADKIGLDQEYFQTEWHLDETLPIPEEIEINCPDAKHDGKG